MPAPKKIPPGSVKVYELCEVEIEAFDGSGASDVFWAEGEARQAGWGSILVGTGPMLNPLQRKYRRCCSRRSKINEDFASSLSRAFRCQTPPDQLPD